MARPGHIEPGSGYLRQHGAGERNDPGAGDNWRFGPDQPKVRVPRRSSGRRHHRAPLELDRLFKPATPTSRWPCTSWSRAILRLWIATRATYGTLDAFRVTKARPLSMPADRCIHTRRVTGKSRSGTKMEYPRPGARLPAGRWACSIRQNGKNRPGSGPISPGRLSYPAPHSKAPNGSGTRVIRARANPKVIACSSPHSACPAMPGSKRPNCSRRATTSSVSPSTAISSPAVSPARGGGTNRNMPM